MPDYVCSRCRAALTPAAEAFACQGCGATFPVAGGIADFSEGRYYDNFSPGQALSDAEREGLRNEIPGAESRVRDFYQPLLERERGLPARRLRILDSGCGNGLSVDLLRDAGFDAWGIDLSALRKWQWRERRHPDRLACADSARLPFPDGFFDAILCSGVLEHVGVRESGGESYSVEPLPGRDAARASFLAEHARVLTPRGVLLLDFPNGAFPIDFWHSPRAGAARWHRLDEGFLPKVSEVRALAAALPEHFEVRVLGSDGRLHFRQVGRHWWGRLLAPLAGVWLRLLGTRLLAPLRQTFLNPFLVLELRRTP